MPSQESSDRSAECPADPTSPYRTSVASIVHETEDLRAIVKTLGHTKTTVCVHPLIGGTVVRTARRSSPLEKGEDAQRAGERSILDRRLPAHPTVGQLLEPGRGGSCFFWIIESTSHARMHPNRCEDDPSVEKGGRRWDHGNKLSRNAALRRSAADGSFRCWV